MVKLLPIVLRQRWVRLTHCRAGGVLPWPFGVKSLLVTPMTGLSADVVVEEGVVEHAWSALVRDEDQAILGVALHRSHGPCCQHVLASSGPTSSHKARRWVTPGARLLHQGCRRRDQRG